MTHRRCIQYIVLHLYELKVRRHLSGTNLKAKQDRGANLESNLCLPALERALPAPCQLDPVATLSYRNGLMEPESVHDRAVLAKDLRGNGPTREHVEVQKELWGCQPEPPGDEISRLVWGAEPGEAIGLIGDYADPLGDPEDLS